MRLPTFLILLALTCLFASCTNSTEKTPTKVKLETWPKVEIENNQKWKANPETTQGIKAMQKIVSSQNNENADVLKENLRTEFKLIFKNCTMEGKAHDQLHNYLLPLRDKLNEINTENQQDKVKEIETYLTTYFQYFE